MYTAVRQTYITVLSKIKQLVIAKVTVYIDRELEKAIRIAAIEDEKKFGQWVSEAFQEKLDRRKRVDKETKPKK
jgi:hypothetical protein